VSLANRLRCYNAAYALLVIPITASGLAVRNSGRLFKRRMRRPSVASSHRARRLSHSGVKDQHFRTEDGAATGYDYRWFLYDMERNVLFELAEAFLAVGRKDASIGIFTFGNDSSVSNLGNPVCRSKIFRRETSSPIKPISTMDLAKHVAISDEHQQ